MSFERMTAGGAMGAEGMPAAAAASGDAPDGISAALRVQILATEHWSLLASRALAWNEVFSRAGMFLSTLSGAVVALALAAQASDFGEGFRLFALVILPIVLFIGFGTLLRLDVSNYHDSLCVIGMNRIRAAYLEMAPELDQYFVMSAHDDIRGLEITMGIPPRQPFLAHLISASPALVLILNSVLAAVIAALAAVQLEADTWLVLTMGGTGFVVVVLTQGLFARKSISSSRGQHEPLFPSPADD